ncbi:MAG TPA: hypothetical protein VMV18_04120, partial [bacterium]|nr:hypothetical protein [bacterium]
MRASTRSILAVALATSAFAALPARAREHELKVPDDSYGIWFPDRSNFDEDVPPPTKATLDALRAADKDRKVEWDEASRTLTVDFPGNADHAPVIATRTRIRWGTNGSIALLETTGNAGDTDTYFCPCTFEGWSENLGAVYRLDKKRTYIAFKGGEIRSFRLFDKHLEWTEPSFAGAVTPWKSVAAAVEDAVKNKDVAAADRALGGRTPPIWGEPGLLWLRVEYLRHPIADVAPLAARLKASTTIEARVDALDALNAYRKAATPLRKREWDALRGKYGTIAGAPKQPGELAEEAATKLIDAEIPRLLRDVQARAETAMRAGRFGEARSMGAVAHRMRCNPEAIRLESETEKAFLWSTFGNTNPDYYNVTLIKG